MNLSESRPRNGAANERRAPSSLNPELFSIAHGAGLVFAGSMVGSGLRYVFQLLVARSLGAELFGIFLLGLTVFSVAEVIVQLGLPNGVVRYVALYNGQSDRSRVKGTVIRAVQSSFVSGLVIGVGLVILSRPLAVGVFSSPRLVPVLLYFAAILPFSAIGAILSSAFQGFKAVSYKVVIGELAEPSLRIVSACVLFMFGWTLSKLLAAYGLVTLLTVLLSVYGLRRIVPQIFTRALPAIYEFKKLFAFSWPLLFVYFLGYLLMATDTFMLGILRTAKEVGIYGAAQRTGYLCSLILTAFGTIFAPVIADLYHRKKLAEVKLIFQIVSKWMLAVSLPVCAVIVLASQNIVGLFGPAFAPGDRPLRILAVGWLAQSSIGLSGTVLTMSGRSKLHLLNFSLLFLLNVLLNYLFIPRLGMTGAALGTVISLAAGALLILLEISWIMKIHPFHADDLKALAAAAGAAVCVWAGLKHVFFRQNILQLATIAFAYLGIYLIIWMFLKVGQEDRKILRMLFARMRGKD